jgi:hypothetical protein
MNNIEISIDGDLHIIRVTCHGKLDWSCGPDISGKPRELAVENGYGILYDLRDASPDAKTMDFYRYAREIQATRFENLKYIRSALLISSGPRKADWSFYETTAKNVGINVRLFIDKEEEALKWAASSK